MATRKATTALGALVAFSLSAALSGCAPSPEVIEGSSVVVGVTQPFTSYNVHSGQGLENTTNAALIDVTSSTFFSYDAQGTLQPHPEWGSARVVSDDPFRVEYALGSDARWSDGVEVDATDLLLAWAANSGALNDDGVERDEVIDPESGAPRAGADPSLVFFDGDGARGLAHAAELPEVGGEGRSITVTFDSLVADWRLIGDVGLPAHRVGEKEGSGEDPAETKSRVHQSIITNDRAELAELAHTWNAAYSWDEHAGPTRELVGNGPYSVTAVVPGESTVLTANPHYRGARKPTIETVTLRYFDDDAAIVDALSDGTVDVAGELTNPEALALLRNEPGLTVEAAPSAAWERLDVRVHHSRSGALEDPQAREAFLLSVPRDAIMADLVHPLAPETAPRHSFLFASGTDGDDAARASGFAETDPERARAILAELGGGQREVCILFDATNTQRQREFELIRDAANSVGFTVTDCSTPEWRELLALDGAYDVALYSVREANFSAASVQAMYASGSQMYRTIQLSDPEVDAAIERLSHQIGTPEEHETRAAIDASLWAHRIGLPLFDHPQVVAYAARVTVPPAPFFAPSPVANCWSWVLGDP